MESIKALNAKEYNTQSTIFISHTEICLKEAGALFTTILDSIWNESLKTMKSLASCFPISNLKFHNEKFLKFSIVFHA